MLAILVRAGNNAPCCAIPVLGEGSQLILADRPDIVGRDGYNCVKIAETRMRSGNDAPTGTIPMLSQSVKSGRPNSPNVTGRNSGYTQKLVALSNIRTGDNTPTAAG